MIGISDSACLNIYGYVRGNILGGIDPYGLVPYLYGDIRSIVHQSNLSGFSDELITCIIWTESSFDPFAASGTGAVGLMQVSGVAVRDLNRVSRSRGQAFARSDVVVDPLVNVAAGSAFLRLIYDLYTGQNLSSAIQRYSTEPGYPVAKILECEKCLKEIRQICEGDPQKCLEKIHR